ncbi:MAG: iron-sulfur cluster assembly scaffold protein [Thermodesulfobacteriota bacterium]
MLEEKIMERVMDHYDNPRNFGKLKDPDIIQRGGNQSCGDNIIVYMNVENCIVTEISFDGEGCIISQAATSILTDIVKGKSIEEINKLDSEYLKELIGKDIIIRRPHCSKLGLETIKFGIKNFDNGNENPCSAAEL